MIKALTEETYLPIYIVHFKVKNSLSDSEIRVEDTVGKEIASYENNVLQDIF